MLGFKLDRRKSQNMYFLWLEKLISVTGVYFKIVLGVLFHYSSPLYRNVCSHTALGKDGHK